MSSIKYSFWCSKDHVNSHLSSCNCKSDEIVTLLDWSIKFIKDDNFLGIAREKKMNSIELLKHIFKNYLDNYGKQDDISTELVSLRKILEKFGNNKIIINEKKNNAKEDTRIQPIDDGFNQVFENIS